MEKMSIFSGNLPGLVRGSLLVLVVHCPQTLPHILQVPILAGRGPLSQAHIISAVVHSVVCLISYQPDLALRTTCSTSPPVYMDIPSLRGSLAAPLDFKKSRSKKEHKYSSHSIKLKERRQMGLQGLLIGSNGTPTTFPST